MKTYLKKNKFLFFLPLMLLPFVILIFYVLGGGEDAKKQEQKELQNSEGANYILPEAEKSIEIFDKMEAYQQQDNGKEGMNHSAWNPDSISEAKQIPNDSAIITESISVHQNQQLPENLLAHIKQKEKEVRDELDAPEQSSVSRTANAKKASNRPVVKKKQKAKPVLQTTGIEELDKVFDENVVLNRQNDSLTFYLAQSQKQLAQIEQFKNRSFSLDKKQHSGFGGDEDKSPLIQAEIYETTTVLNGNRVKLRVLEDTWVNNKKVARNSFIYGICTIKNERLQIQITQLPIENSFLPVNLTIHDLDGLPGLYVPDNVARKVTQEVGSSTNTSSMFGVTANPLAYAGIRAADKTAQTLLKRVRLKKVTVKKNTLVYLINQK
jgi:hypothetical protein